MKVYLDYAATTPLDKDVLDAMLPYMTEYFANSHSQHSFARPCAEAVDKARKQVAAAINAAPNEIYFTGSGSEADNWALKGVASARSHKGKHIIISPLEHAAIRNTALWLKSQGFEITELKVDNYGVVDLEDLEKSIREDTILVSVMYANNEVGTIEPVKEIAEIAHKHGVLVHSDCVQAMGAIPVDVKALGADMISISAHKFNGPKGIGALYVRNGLHIERLIHGGGQERSMRGGTSNTPAIVGMGYAIEKAVKIREEHAKHCIALRDHLIERIEKEIPYVRLNGHRTQRLPNNVNFSFEYIEGESILMGLDLNGIAVSSGSACSSGSLEPSHVLLSIGVPIEIAHGSIRFTVGNETTMAQIDYTVDTLKTVVARLRAMSPLFNLKSGDVSFV